ncbi:MAG TPA: aldehyde dehydrogenase family protein [Anaerolineales bacterium]|nr:aldehyde dehydrogenase family protein [Anaerolineales bacterium]
MDSWKNLIDGKWVEPSGGTYFENSNPAHPDQILGRFPSASTSDVKEAIRAAANALSGWASTPGPRRGEILEKASRILEGKLEEMAVTLTREEGKTLKESRGEVGRIPDIFRYFAGEGWRTAGQVLPGLTQGESIFTLREPLGVVGIVTPWNFPALIPAWKIAPALVFGNTLVFKPASLAPQVGLLLTQVLQEAGLPDGVLNYITGSGTSVGQTLISDEEVKGISFTGSYEVGKTVSGQMNDRMKRVQCEMGGKNALVVLRDSNLDTAVALTIRGGFGLSGQACTATSRVIVEESVADAFVAKLTAAAEMIVIGDGMDEATTMGPLASAEQKATVLAYVETGKGEGAKLLTGGQAGPDEGYYVLPTVFDDVDPDMRIAQEEIFGPVISVLRARDFDHAIELANQIAYGLTAGIVTNRLDKAFEFANRIEVGIVKVNQATTGTAPHAPFGGFKRSSANTFKEQGQAAIEFYTRTKTVYFQYGTAH